MNEPANPFDQFARVFAAAQTSGVIEPSAFCLATVDAEGQPSARMLLLKGFDSRGFVFYTNLESSKGRQLAGNPNAAMCFFWPPIGSQVRIEGRVEPVGSIEADEYFRTRERGSQIGAWASLQSSELRDRQQLLDRVTSIEAQYDGIEVPRPEHWSGYRLAPRLIEFWTASEFRLHDRLVYERSDGDAWRSYRVYP